MGHIAAETSSRPSRATAAARRAEADARTAAELHGALLGVMHVMRGHLEEVAASAGLTAQQAITLFRLGQVEAMPMGELADELHCDRSNVTGIADRLEERGLVERRARPGDRRVKELVLTATGREMRTELTTRVNQDVPGLRSLGRGDRETLLRILTSVLDAAGAAPVHGPD